MRQLGMNFLSLSQEGVSYVSITMCDWGPFTNKLGKEIVILYRD